MSPRLPSLPPWARRAILAGALAGLSATGLGPADPARAAGIGSTAPARGPATGAHAPPAAAATQEQAEAARYETCLKLARSKAQEGFDAGEEWRDGGGGAPAQHCIAIALVGLRQYTKAADLLTQIAGRLDKSQTELRAHLLGQAGEADIIADRPAAARDAFSEALKIKPRDIDFLIDRGRAQAALGKYWEAVDDFNSAVEVNRNRAEPLIYRAGAYTKLKSLDLALDDIQHALQLAPDSPLALLQRGDVESLRGDKVSARRDWLKVSLLAPNTPLQIAAQANLEKLDLDPTR